MAPAKGKETMSSEQFRAALVRLGLGIGEFGRMLGCARRTVQRYANDEPIPPELAGFLRLAVRYRLKPEQIARVLSRSE